MDGKPGKRTGIAWKAIGTLKQGLRCKPSSILQIMGYLYGS